MLHPPQLAHLTPAAKRLGRVRCFLIDLALHARPDLVHCRHVDSVINDAVKVARINLREEARDDLFRVQACAGEPVCSLLRAFDVLDCTFLQLATLDYVTETEEEKTLKKANQRKRKSTPKDYRGEEVCSSHTRMEAVHGDVGSIVVAAQFYLQTLSHSSDSHLAHAVRGGTVIDEPNNRRGVDEVDLLAGNEGASSDDARNEGFAYMHDTEN